MARERLSMRKINEVLRLRFELHCSHREIARSIGAASSTVADYLRRFAEAGLSWPLSASLSEADLEAKLFPSAPSVPGSERAMPDWAALHAEMRRPGVTLMLLWQEYRGRHPRGFAYSWFCEHYRAWVGTARPGDAPGAPRRREAVRGLRRADACRSPIATPVSFVPPRSSWPCWALRTTPTPRPPGARSCPSGSARTYAALNSSAGYPRSPSRTTSRARSRTRTATSPSSTPPIVSWPVTTAWR